MTAIKRLMHFSSRWLNKKPERVKNYPVSAVNNGINACISNSRDLLNTAWLLLDQNKFEHSFIFYTYAEEEFGKALLLLDKKNDAVSNGEDVVRNDTAFYVHTKKLKRAEEHHKALGIQLIDTDKIPVIDLAEPDGPPEPVKVTFVGREGFEYEEKTFSDLDTRLAFLYIDYAKKSQWRKPHFKPDYLELTLAFEALRDALEALEKSQS